MQLTLTEIFNMCMKKPKAYEDYPFGPHCCTVKVEKRIFAQLFKLNGADTVTLNCTLEGGELYRSLYPGIITRGYHCPPVQQPYFNSFPINAVPKELVEEMINHSYKTVVAKLPKYKQADILK